MEGISRRGVLLAVALFLLLVLIMAPARLLFIGLEKADSGITALSTDGTVWAGSAGYLSIQTGDHHIALEQANWDLHMLSLLLGRLCATVDAKAPGQLVNGEVCVSMGGTIQLEDMRVRAPVAQLQNFIPFPIDISGNAGLDIAHARLEDNVLTELNGVAQWVQAGLALGPAVEPLGDFQANLGVNENQTLIVDLVENPESPLRVSGRVSLNTKQRYQVSITMQPSEQMNPAIGQALAMFSRKQGPNSYQLKLNGSL